MEAYIIADLIKEEAQDISFTVNLIRVRSGMKKEELMNTYGN